MERTLASYLASRHGRLMMGGEPLILHSDHDNALLQSAVLLDDRLGMEIVIHDAAQAAVHALLVAAGRERSAVTGSARRQLAEDTFAQLGFGKIDLASVGPEGGTAVLAVSHHGSALRPATGERARPRSYFDAGYAAAAAAFLHGRPPEAFSGAIEACIATGATAGRIAVTPRAGRSAFYSPGIGGRSRELAPPPFAATSVDEPAILTGLAALDFTGNAQGLMPRFGLTWTHHLASFYCRVAFEFVRRMTDAGLGDGAEAQLGEAGLRGAFHTFGAIMTSPEWDALVKPQCKDRSDLVHGLVAVINAFGWGAWRVFELSPERVAVRIYDDYESCGYRGMYGKAARPVSHLAAAAVAGIMNLVYVARIDEHPALDAACYARAFEAPERFTARHTRSLAVDGGYTEIVACR
jgi:hypothetical protein